MSITIEARYQADTAAQAISNNATIDHNQLWLSGTATPGDLLRIYDGHSYLTLISADSSGRWNYPIELLADGDYQFQIQNLTAGVNSNSLAITIDTGGQTIPPVILPERTYIFEGGTSDDSTPTISGQLTPGTILTATANGYTYGPIEVGADGKWEIEMTEGLPEGESVVAFMLQQPSGQTAYYGMRMNIESPEPELTAVEAAVTAAAASSRVAPPSIEAVEDNVGRFQGLLQSGNHSDDDIPLMRGQAEAFALVEIYDNDVLIGSVYAAASGAWRYSPTTALPEGEHRFHAIQIDLNGERSGASDKFDIVIDRTAEVVTNLRAVDDVGAQTGVIPQNGVSDDEMPVIRGGGSPGATIEIFNGNISLGTAVVDANGEWSFAANLGEGEHIISAIHTDLAVNTGPRSEAINFEVRLGLEAAEAIRILDGGDEHLSQADLRGQVGVEVELSDNALAGQRLEIDVNGDGISDGSHVITAADIGNTVQVQIAGSEFARFDNGVLRATAVVTSPGTDRRSDAISDTSNATVLTLTRNEDSEYTTTAVVNMWQGNKLSSVHVGKSGGGIFDFDIDTPNQVLNGSHSVVVKLAGIDDIWYVYHWSSYAFEQGGSVDISELYSERQGYLDQGAIHWFWDKAYQIFMDTDKLKAPPTSSGQLPAAGVGGVSEAAGEDLWHTTVYDTRSYNVTLELGLRDNATGEVSTFETLNFDHQLIHYLTVNWNAITPLVLDLDGDGVETLGSEDAIIFDINADGYVDKTGWVAADDGLLVRDINGDGVINDGSELFGAATTMADGSKAEQGFAALADLDSNGDGVFDSRDQAYGELQVWRDINADGISQASELMGLMEAGVASIDLNAREVAEFDQENYQGLRSSWVDTEGASHDIDDVWFVVDLGSADNNAPEALAYEELLASAAESVLTGNGQNEASLPEATMLDLTAEPELLQHQCYWEALS